MENNKILQFGLDLIDLLKKDERLSIGEDELHLYLEGFSSDDKELADFVANTNKVYHNSADNELHGNYLVYRKSPGPNAEHELQTQIRYNLDAYYKKYLKSNIDAVEKSIADDMIKQSDAGSEIDDTLLSKDYERLKPRLMIRMLNFPHNSVRLDGTVFRRFGDMAICAYMLISDDRDGDGNYLTSKITNEMLSIYNVTADRIMEDAFESGREKYPERIFFNILESVNKKNEGTPLDEAIRMVKSGERVIAPPNTTLVLTSPIRLNGAAVMFYPGVMSRVSELFGGDYYAVFTSIHEVMLHPREGFAPRRLKERLYETNSNFNPDEMLTDYVYRYDSRRGQLKQL